MRPRQIDDFYGIAVEVFNPHEKPVVMTSIHPERHLHGLEALRIVIPPRSFKKLDHLRYQADFEDGSPCGPLQVNFGDAKGRGVTSAAEYREAHPERFRKS